MKKILVKCSLIVVPTNGICLNHQNMRAVLHKTDVCLDRFELSGPIELDTHSNHVAWQSMNYFVERLLTFSKVFLIAS